jgi:protein-serine/threonine kinase
VAGTNAHGRIAQPTSKGYNVSGPIVQDEPDYPHISATQVPDKFARIAGLKTDEPVPEQKSHKRSNTVSSFVSRTASIFGGKKDKNEDVEKKGKKYPPVSMSGGIGTGNDAPRQSMDSRRSISFGFNKKRSGSIAGSQTTLQDKQTRRFSLLPASFSLKSIGIGKDHGSVGTPTSDAGYDDRPDSRGNYLDNPNPHYSQSQPQFTSQPQARNVSSSTAAGQSYASDGVYDRQRDSPLLDRRGTSTASPPQSHQRYASQSHSDPRSGAPPQFLPPINFHQDQSALTTESESSLNEMANRPRGAYPPGFGDPGRPAAARTNSSGRGVLTKNNRKFTDAYEQDQGNGYGPTHSDHAGSSGAARKVMDFFRRRGKDRGGER